MSHSSAQLAALETPLWFCLKAQPKREHLAAVGLRRQLKIDCFAPRLRFRKSTRRGPVWFVEAMFPGYLFAQFVYSTQSRRVESAPGIQRTIRFGDRVATLDADTIAAVRQNVRGEEILTIDPLVEVGQSVRIADGPLQGLEALVIGLLPAKERVQVLLGFLGRTVETEMPTPNVLPAIAKGGIWSR